MILLRSELRETNEMEWTLFFRYLLSAATIKNVSDGLTDGLIRHLIQHVRKSFLVSTTN